MRIWLMILPLVAVAVACVPVPDDGGSPPVGSDGTVDMTSVDPDMAVAARDMAGPDMTSPDMADPDVADPDMADPDAALPDAAVPDMADPDVALPDAAVPDLAVADPDMAVADPDMAVADPDMALPDPDMAPPDPDMGPPCAPGDVEERGCGLNGRGRATRRCTIDGWSMWGPCDDPDVCVDGTARDEACGLNGRGQAPAQCVAGAWRAGDCADPDACVDGAVRDEACGLNGRGQRPSICVAGAWDVGACDDPDVCTDGADRPDPCGLNGRGEARARCAEGRWQPGECVDPDVCRDGELERAPCPDGPDRERRCVDGAWSAWSDCVEPEVGLVINEVYLDPPGFDHISSFVELWGPPGMDLDGVRVVAINGLNGRVYEEVELAGPLPADGFYVIAHPGVEGETLAAADLIDRIGDLQNGPDAVQLWRGDERLDALAYGDSDYGEGDPAPDPDDLSLTRDPRGHDTDDNRADFVIAEPTPGRGLPGGCAPGQVEALPCGLNGRGVTSRECGPAGWGGWSVCADPDRCVDGEQRHEPCDGGRRTQECIEGAWWQLPGCNCIPDSVEERACGLNDRGREIRECLDGGNWSIWRGCQDPDICVDGTIEDTPCDDGTRTRECVVGAWTEGPCLCAPGAVQEAVCGLNDRGRQTRQCDGGEWAPWSPCDDADVCVDGQAEDLPCDEGVFTRRCDAGAWVEEPCRCIEGETEDLPCDDGIFTRRCTGGEWVDEACRCIPGTEEDEACGLNDRGVRGRTCGPGGWDPWGACDDPDVCVDDTVEDIPCHGGTLTRTCDAGRWQNGPCLCADGDVDERACGFNFAGVEHRECVGEAWGAWSPCDDPDVCVNGHTDHVPCPGAVQPRHCVDGQWSVGECGCGVPSLMDGDPVLDIGWTDVAAAETSDTVGRCNGGGAEAARWFVASSTGTWRIFMRPPDREGTVLSIRSGCDESTEYVCEPDRPRFIGRSLYVWLEEGDFVLVVADQPAGGTAESFEIHAWNCDLSENGCPEPPVCRDGSVQPIECPDGSPGAQICDDSNWVDSLCNCDMEAFFDIAEPTGDGGWVAGTGPSGDLPPTGCSPHGHVGGFTLTAPAPETWVFDVEPPVALEAQRLCGQRATSMHCAPAAEDGSLIVPLGADETASVLLGGGTGSPVFDVTGRPCSLLNADHPCRVATPCGDGAEWVAPCGINGRGYGLRRCDDGAWTVLECEDPDACTDGEIRPTEAPCPDGTQATDVCNGGAWSALGCLPATCAPGEHIGACGRYDRGQRVRQCTYTDGVGWDYEPWSPCDDPDTCEVGQPGCVLGFWENGYEAQGILRVAGLNRDTLWNAVDLGRVLSLAITEEQQVVPTSTWPGWTWPSLAALVAVDGVDAAALDLMFVYAADRGWNGRCGDGRIQPASEQCDDGNAVDGDGCSAECVLETVCGDGVVEGVEQCDSAGAECDAICRFTTLPRDQNVVLGQHRQVDRLILMQPNNNISSRTTNWVEVTVPQRTRVELYTETGPQFGWYGSTRCPRITYTTNNDVGARNFTTDFRPTVRFDPVPTDAPNIDVRSPLGCNTDIAVELPPNRYRMTFVIELPGGAIREDAIIGFTAFVDGWTPLGGPTCGDGVVEASEECDDGNQRGLNCQADCRWPRVTESPWAEGRLLPDADTVIAIGSLNVRNIPSDTDRYRIELDEPSDIFIGLTTPDGDCAFDSAMDLRHDADAVGRAVSVPTGPDGCPEIAVANWPAGASTIQVHGEPDVGNDAEYRLTVTRSPAD